MNQLAEREQLRLKDLPSLDQINARDTGLGQLLDRLTTSVSGRRVDVSQAASLQVPPGKGQREIIAQGVHGACMLHSSTYLHGCMGIEYRFIIMHVCLS